MTKTMARSLENVSTTDSPIYTLFETETADELTREQILRVSAGVLGAVIIEDFASTADCEHIMRNVEEHALGSYDEEIIYPPIAKLGPAAYDFYGEGSLDKRYWTVAADAAMARSTMMYGADPLDHAMDRVRAAWGDDVEPARCQGRPMFAGMIREMLNGAKLHFDEIVREFPGALDETPAGFVTFNWYLSTPESGGETLVYRRRWKPSDEHDRDGYGYSERLVHDEPVAVITPRAGTAAIFDSRNFHVVRKPHGRRLSVSFFLGITGRGPLITWS